MSKHTLIALFIGASALVLAGCVPADTGAERQRWQQDADLPNGILRTCVGGVSYLQGATRNGVALTLQVDRDGKPVACEDAR